MTGFTDAKVVWDVRTSFDAGRLILALRKRGKHSQRDVAKALGISQNSYARMEHSPIVRTESLARIAYVFGYQIALVPLNAKPREGLLLCPLDPNAPLPTDDEEP